VKVKKAKIGGTKNYKRRWRYSRGTAKIVEGASVPEPPYFYVYAA